jgi:hypothetical protein
LTKRFHILRTASVFLLKKVGQFDHNNLAKSLITTFCLAGNGLPSPAI